MLWPSYSRNGVIGMTTGMSSSSLAVAHHSCGHAWSHTVQSTATYNAEHAASSSTSCAYDAFARFCALLLQKGGQNYAPCHPGDEMPDAAT